MATLILCYRSVNTENADFFCFGDSSDVSADLPRRSQRDLFCRTELKNLKKRVKIWFLKHREVFVVQGIELS